MMVYDLLQLLDCSLEMTVVELLQIIFIDRLTGYCNLSLYRRFRIG